MPFAMNHILKFEFRMVLDGRPDRPEDLDLKINNETLLRFIGWTPTIEFVGKVVVRNLCFVFCPHFLGAMDFGP